MKKIKDDTISTKTRIIVKYREPEDGCLVTTILGKRKFHPGYRELLRKNVSEDYFRDLKNGNFYIDMGKYFEDTGKVFLPSMYHNNSGELVFENRSVKPISFKKETTMTLVEHFGK